MKKYCLYVLIGLLLVVGCTGCGKNESEPKKEEEQKIDLVGGYSVINGVAGTLPEEALRAFNNATKNDKKYTPLALMGTQVVAGTNYMVLARENDKLVVLVIFEDLSQKATITNTYDFNLLNHLSNDFAVGGNNELAGGWTVSKDGGLNSMPQNLASAYSEAFTNYEGIRFEPLACVGSQVVAGTNYAMLARGVVNGETEYGLYIVVIYDDINGNASVKSVNHIDLASINNNN